MQTKRSGATHLSAGEGKKVWMVGTDLITFKATSETTGGEYALFDSLILPQGGPPPHIHHRKDESFYVLEGEFESWTGIAPSGRKPAPSCTFPKEPCTRSRT